MQGMQWVFSLSAALTIPNLSYSLLAHPPDKTAGMDELSYTVLRLILQKENKKRWDNWPSAPEMVSQKATGFLSQPGMHRLCHSCSSWSAPLLQSLPGDQAKQSKTLLTEHGQPKGQVSKGLADQSNQSQQ